MQDALHGNSAKWREREEWLDDERMIWFKGDYVQAVIEQTDCPSFDVEGVNKPFMEWERHKLENTQCFRDNRY